MKGGAEAPPVGTREPLLFGHFGIGLRRVEEEGTGPGIKTTTRIYSLTIGFPYAKVPDLIGVIPTPGLGDLGLQQEQVASGIVDDPVGQPCAIEAAIDQLDRYLFQRAIPSYRWQAGDPVPGARCAIGVVAE